MEIRNWAGNVTFTPEVLHRPRTVEELQDLVAGSPRLRTLGSGHSFNRIADTEGELVSVRELAGPITVDADARTVSVPAGARYGEITTAVQAQGWALHNLGSLPHISVAGACATGTHGSGVGNRSLPTAAVAVEFVRADGELVRLSRADDPDVFGGSVLALGALGVVTRLTLEVQPTYDVAQLVYLDMPLDTLVAHVGEVMAAGYSVSVFTDWSRTDTVEKVWVKRRLDTVGGTTPVDAPAEWLGAKLAAEPQHAITGQDATASTEQLGVPGPWHTRLPHFRLEFTPSSGEEVQSEFMLPLEHAGAAVEALRGIAATIAPALQVFELRTIAADDLWLSPAHGRDTVAVHFTWVADPERYAPALAAVEAAMAPFDPRPHWGKVFQAQPERVAAHYPRLADFRALVRRHDPDGVFGNAFLDTFVWGTA